jgi:hypothetical protein
VTLANFHETVKGALRRGSSQDTIIPTFTRLAAKWLEQNYTFSYMWRTLEIELDPEADTPNFVEFDDEVKVVEFMRVRYDSESDASSEFGYILAAPSREFTSIATGTPGYYWLENDGVWFDAVVDEATTVEMRAALYTDWPTDTSANPTLLRRYENVLLARTMIVAATHLKDNDMKATWADMFQNEISAALVAEEEGKRAEDSPVMRYSGLG